MMLFQKIGQADKSIALLFYFQKHQSGWVTITRLGRGMDFAKHDPHFARFSVKIRYLKHTRVIAVKCFILLLLNKLKLNCRDMCFLWIFFFLPFMQRTIKFGSFHVSLTTGWSGAWPAQGWVINGLFSHSHFRVRPSIELFAPKFATQPVHGHAFH